MVAAEVWQRRSVDDRALRRPQHALENGMRVGAGDGVHAVEADPEPGGEQRADGVEIEQRRHQLSILRDRIDDLDRRVFEPDFAEPIDVDVGRVRNFVGAYRLAAGKDFVGDLLRGRSAGADVVFDAEVTLRAARIVARRQDDPAEGAEMADEG